ncbi:MAG: hypothetical protein QF893_07655 [Alphaproteobacteria bacterium]|jgi:hypothetical protein|nr:hypothetical protein [Alphaproteobacteria bacterium]
MTRLLLSISILISMLALLASGGAAAGQVSEFHTVVAEASGHYRQAGFYLRTGNTMVAAFELAQMREKWGALVDRFGKAPPDPYAQDAAWRETLDNVGGRIERSLAAVEAGDAAVAKTELAPVRSILGKLRRRNGVFLFSDCVDQANAAFRQLFQFRHAPPDFERWQEVDKLRRALAVTSHWYERCRDEAPVAYAQDPQFERLMRTSLDSLSRIWAAIEGKDARRLISILRELGSSDRLLYLRFG